MTNQALELRLDGILVDQRADHPVEVIPENPLVVDLLDIPAGEVVGNPGTPSSSSQTLVFAVAGVEGVVDAEGRLQIWARALNGVRTRMLRMNGVKGFHIAE